MPNDFPPYYPLKDPFDAHIILADGIEIDGNGALASGTNSLWLWPENMTLVKAATTFSDTSKTSEITIRHNDKRTVYAGYTKLTDIKTRSVTGGLAVCLEKE